MPLLAACQTTSQGPAVSDAREDVCAVHRAAFRTTEPTFSVGQRAALAVGAGAVAGVVTGLVTGNASAGFAVGASVAAIGITAVLVDASFQQMREDQRRQALLSQTVAVDRFGERVTGAQLALERLTTCRRQQVATVRSQVARGGMPRADGQAELQKIRGWFEDDVTLVRAFDQRLGNESRQLADSSRHINSAGLNTDAAFRGFTGIAARESQVKTSASTGATDAGAVRPGQTIRVTAREGAWYRVALPNGRTGYVQASAVAREAPAREYQGSTESSLREAALDDASERGRVASGNPYRVIGNLPGWLVVDQGSSRRSFVRAAALRPASVDVTGREVLQSTATAVAARDAFSAGAEGLAGEARSIRFDL